ncbi:unnamed protein product [Peronospora belbahrii]|nr:unnamed protein product [Peronospora belbahrii]
MFVPILCLLPTDGNRLCNDAAVKKAMNRVCKRAGDRFVHNNVYRPLKAAMVKELQFVRYVPQRKRERTNWRGLVAGISPCGVFCGLYIASEFWPYDS